MLIHLKNVVILKSFLSLMISINILQCSAVEILPAKQNEGASGSPRNGLFQLKKFGLPWRPNEQSKKFELPLKPEKVELKIQSQPPAHARLKPVPFPRVFNILSPSPDKNSNNNKTNVSPDKISQNTTTTTTTTPSLDELEKSLLEPGIECGKVPLFENLYKRSINESFDKNPDAENEGEARILHGLDSQA